MKKAQLAYIAGIMDGEGSIGIYKVPEEKCRGHYTYRLIISVTNKNEWLCQYLKFALGVGFVGYNPQNLWHWTAVAQKALAVLQLLLPYLNLKRPQAEIAIKFQSAKRQRGSKTKTEGEWAIEEAQRISIQEAKQQA